MSMYTRELVLEALSRGRHEEITEIGDFFGSFSIGYQELFYGISKYYKKLDQESQEKAK